MYPGPCTSFPLPARGASSADHREIYVGEVTGGGIDLQTDWNGDDDCPGQLQVKLGDRPWVPCKNIRPSRENDIVLPSRIVEGEVFLARLHRGPLHPSCPFGVKAIPIRWIDLPEEMTIHFLAVRGTHYEYADGTVPELIDWQMSELSDGVQRVPLPLQTDRDYELWVPPAASQRPQRLAPPGPHRANRQRRQRPGPRLSPMRCPPRQPKKSRSM